MEFFAKLTSDLKETSKHKQKWETKLMIKFWLLQEFESAYLNVVFHLNFLSTYFCYYLTDVLGKCLIFSSNN